MSVISVRDDEFGHGIFLETPQMTFRTRAFDNLEEIYEARLCRHKKEVYIELKTNCGDDTLDLRELSGNLGLKFNDVIAMVGDIVKITKEARNGEI